LQTRNQSSDGLILALKCLYSLTDRHETYTTIPVYHPYARCQKVRTPIEVCISVSIFLQKWDWLQNQVLTYLHFCTKYEGSSTSVCTKTDKLHYPLDGNLQLPNKVSSIVTGILVVALHKKSMEQSYLYELKLDGLF